MPLPFLADPQNESLFNTQCNRCAIAPRSSELSAAQSIASPAHITTQLTAATSRSAQPRLCFTENPEDLSSPAQGQPRPGSPQLYTLVSCVKQLQEAGTQYKRPRSVVRLRSPSRAAGRPLLLRGTSSRSATAADIAPDTCRKASSATRPPSIATRPRLLQPAPPLGLTRRKNSTRFRRCMSLDCSATRIKDPGDEQRPGTRSNLVEHALQDS
jgi:hypothetical protein